MKNIIDVSDWQGIIDWEKMKSQIDGAMIRCCWSYGEKNDKHFERNISECNRLGIPCGVYLFSYALNDEEAKKEAEWCLELIKHYRIELPVAWDFEYDSVNYCARHGITVTKAMATRWAKIFLQTVEKAGYWASLYANRDFLTRYFEKNIEKRFDLWYAGWVKPEEATYNSKLSYSCGMWQYGTKTYGGMKGSVDSNYCYKDYPTMLRSLGLNHLSKAAATEKDINEGDTVRVKKGAKTYTGEKLASFVYERDHKVMELNGERAVITYGKVVVAAVNVSDLTLVKEG